MEILNCVSVFFSLSLQNIQLSAKSQASWKHNKPLIQAKSNKETHIHEKARQMFEGGVLKACRIGWIIKGEVDGCSGDVLRIKKKKG